MVSNLEAITAKQRRDRTMESNDLGSIIESSLSKNLLRPDQIPSLDLYIDQILTLVSDKVGSIGSNGSLTKTMINNYSKDGLIKPIKGKKYSKEHIVQMMLICYLKGVLSIGDIKRIFDGVYACEGFNGDTLISCYDRFLNLKQSEGKLCKIIIEQLINEAELDMEKNEEFFVILMSIVSLSDCLKNVALQMIEKQYPAVDKNTEKSKEKKLKKTTEESNE